MSKTHISGKLPSVVGWLLLLATIASPVPVGAQLTGLAHRVWRVQDGLADQVVQAVTEGADHYLWVGTTRGLWRFDGATFARYDGRYADALRHGVTCLTAARDGSLWIGTEGNGLFQMRGEQMRAFGYPDGLLNPIVRAVKEDPKGRIWVGTDLGVYRKDGDRFVIPLPVGPPRGIGSASLATMPDGRVYSGGTKLIRLDDQGFVEIAFPPDKEPLRIKALAEDGHGGLWVGTLSGVFHMDEKEHVQRVGPKGSQVRVMGRLPEGSVVAGTAGDGLLLERDGAFVAVQSEDLGLPSDTVLSETVDARGNVWVGTQGGLVRLSRTGVHATSLRRGSTADLAGMMRDRDGSIWYTSRRIYQGHGLNDWTARSFPFLEGSRVRTMLRDREGGLWFATAGMDAFRLGADGVAKRVSGLGASYVRTLMQASDGTVWIGTDSGAAAYRDGKVQNFYTTPAAPHTLVLSMAEDRDGSMWFGSQRGLFHLGKDGKYIPLPAEVATRNEAIWALLEDDAGTMWIGSDTGLSVLRGGRRSTVPLRSDAQAPAVYQVLAGKGGAMWIAGPTQVLMVQRTKLEELAAGVAQHVPVRRFSIGTDLPSAEILSGIQPSAFVDADGSAWFTSSDGPLHLIPGERAAEGTFPLRITHVAIDGRTVDPKGTIELLPDTRTLEISFAPIALGPQNDLEFRHRLDGFEGWSEPGPTRTVTYTNLRPGTYTFSAELVGSGAEVLASAPALVVHQNARWYQRRATWWMMAAGLGLMVWGVHRVRVHELRANYRAKTEERNRLAREMHDTVIQGCTAVSALLEASEAQGDPLLAYAKEQIRTTIDEARMAVWDLRTYDRHDISLRPALEKVLEDATRGTAIRGEMRAGRDVLLEHDVAHELLMAAREAVLNAVAHSGCSVVSVTVNAGEGLARVFVADDGRGFDLARTPGEDEQHFGLAGMRERMERVHGRIAVSSELDKGTRVELQVPIGNRKAGRFSRLRD